MSGIESLDANIMEACRLYVDNLIKPIYSLGQLETMAVRLSGILRKVKPKDLQKAMVVFAGDTATDGDNQTKGALSLQELQAVASGNGPVNMVARFLDMPVYVVDVGLEKNTADVSGVLQQKAVSGTRQKHPAMTKEETEKAISVGMSVAETLANQGIEAIGLGNIGERALLSALGVTTTIMRKELQEVTVKNGYRLHISSAVDFATDPVGGFSEVGSAEIAALFGLVVQAARRHMAIVFDNAVTGAAVLAAVTVYPQIQEYVFPSVAYDEPIHQMQLQKLGFKGFLHYDFTVAEGFGAALGLSLLDASLDMLNEMKTFGTSGVEVAEDGAGRGRQNEEVR